MLVLEMLTKLSVFHLEFPNSWDMFSSPEGASNTVMENVAKLLQTLYSTLLSCGFTSLQCKFVNWSREDGRILYLVWQGTASLYKSDLYCINLYWVKSSLQWTPNSLDHVFWNLAWHPFDINLWQTYIGCAWSWYKIHSVYFHKFYLFHSSNMQNIRFWKALGHSKSRLPTKPGSTPAPPHLLPAVSTNTCTKTSSKWSPKSPRKISHFLQKLKF